MLWAGKNVKHLGIFNRYNRCVAEIFALIDNRKIPMEDINRFLAPYSSMTIIDRREDEKGNYRFLADKTGKLAAVVAYLFDGNQLEVMTPAFWNAVYEDKTKDAPQPAVAQPQQSSTPNDCLVVATEIYGRLKTTAHWAEIISFYIDYNDGKPAIGHAVALYQPTLASNVFLYDKLIGGSRDLRTQSHDLPEIVNAIESVLKDGVTINEAQWIDAR